MYTRPDFETVKHETAKRHAHARGCKANPTRCTACQDNRRYFDSLPLDTLARVLADESKPANT